MLGGVPTGTIPDGEMIVLPAGKSDFGLLLSHDQTCRPLKIQMLARSLPGHLRGLRSLIPPLPAAPERAVARAARPACPVGGSPGPPASGPVGGGRRR